MARKSSATRDSGRELVAVGVRRERAVRDAFDEESLALRIPPAGVHLYTEELPVGGDPPGRQCPHAAEKLGVDLNCGAHKFEAPYL